MIKVKSEKLFKIIFFISIFSFISSIGCKLYLCNSLAVKNGEFERAFILKNNIDKEIEKLSYDNSTLSSISYIEDRAKEMGFIEMNNRLLSIDPNTSVQVAALTQR